MAQSPNEIDGDQIRTQIEETRAEMSQTIDAIQERLSPGRVLSDAKESATHATATAISRLADRVQEHPIPFGLMVSATAGVLAYGLMRSKRRHARAAGFRSSYPTRRRRAMPMHSRGRLLAAAGVGAACWLFARAQDTPMPMPD
jgi:hypothetical protein